MAKTDSGKLTSFQRFDALARNVLSVPNKAVQKRMEAENKPTKPRKRKRAAVHAAAAS